MVDSACGVEVGCGLLVELEGEAGDGMAGVPGDSIGFVEVPCSL